MDTKMCLLIIKKEYFFKGREMDTRCTIYKKTDEVYQLKLKASRMFYCEVNQQSIIFPELLACVTVNCSIKPIFGYIIVICLNQCIFNVQKITTLPKLQTYQSILCSSFIIKVYLQVRNKHGSMPFNLRSFDKETSARLGVVECVNHKLIEPFQVCSILNHNYYYYTICSKFLASKCLFFNSVLSSIYRFCMNVQVNLQLNSSSLCCCYRVVHTVSRVYPLTRAHARVNAPSRTLNSM